MISCLLTTRRGMAGKARAAVGYLPPHYCSNCWSGVSNPNLHCNASRSL